jgi:signal transduction histidine kinase
VATSEKDELEQGQPPTRPTPSGIAIPRLGKGTQRDVSEKASAARERLGTLSPRDENLRSIAHDLRNPLNVIAMETSMLREILRDYEGRIVHASLRRIAENAAFMDRLIQELLDLSQLEAGRLELVCEPADLSTLVRNAVERMTATQEKGRIAVDLRATAEVRVDRTRIERVVENLIRNALKYAPGSPVTVSLDRTDVRVAISVSDRGPGLSVDEARRVFDRDFRGSSARASQGFGLGLFVSRRIIEAHGGRIGLETSPGRGSRFFFDLPIA